MTYLLDTDSCIHILNNADSPVRQRLSSVSPREVAVCAVVKAELYYGAFKSSRQESNLALLARFFAGMTTLPMNDAAAMQCGRIRADLARRGTPIGPNDLLIAAVALAHEATLVTHNTREFSRIEELRVEDWLTA